MCPAWNRNLLDRHPQTFGHLQASPQLRFHEQHGKLFTPDSGSQIDATGAFSQHSADAAYRLVTGVVTKGVVQLLEVVDVDHQQTERMAQTHVD